MTKVLVTGGAGFIGSHTVDLLLEKGYEVRILDNLSHPVHSNGQVPSYVPREAEFIFGDIRNREDVNRALVGVDLIFHLAAYQDYLTDFSKFFHVNSVGTALIFELIVENNYPVEKVVFASSQAIYGEGKYYCLEHGVQYPDLRTADQLMKSDWEPRCPICGNHIAHLPTDEPVVNPHNQYAVSKHTQELIALNLGKRYGIPTAGLRYSITQGPRQSFYNAYSGICRIFTLRVLNNLPPLAFEDGKQLRDYVYVGDVARANLLALEDDRSNYQVFNVGAGQVATVLDYADMVADVLGKSIEPITPGQFRFGDSRHIVSDCSKLQDLGWKATMPLRKVIEAYAEWAQAQPNARDYSAEAEIVMKQRGAVRTSSVSQAQIGKQELAATPVSPLARSELPGNTIC